MVTDRGKAPTAPQVFYFERAGDKGFRIEAALQWTESHEETIRSYVNGIPTTQGGTHEQGFRAAIVKAVRAFIEHENLAPKGVTLTAEDIREGIVGVLSMYMQEPQFQGQTKERLGSPEAQAAGRRRRAPGAGDASCSRTGRRARRSSSASRWRRRRARRRARRPRRCRARPRCRTA